MSDDIQIYTTKILAAIDFLDTALRRSGRTTEMINNIDEKYTIIVCHDQRYSRLIQTMIREKSFYQTNVKIVIIEPNDDASIQAQLYNYLPHDKKYKIIFDHEWQRLYFKNKVQAAAYNLLDMTKLGQSTFGD